MMKRKILKSLKNLEKSQKIEIIFAVESGSRAWRIDSMDSDYDVRFVYKRDLKEYLKLNKPKEVIECKEGDIDIVGFDIYKFSKLLLSSNPSMIEWLKSDLVYIDKDITKSVFKSFIMKNFNPKTLYYHYKSMCKNNYLKYIKGNTNKSYKKYLYCIRGIVNALWVKNLNKTPPIHFVHTLNSLDNFIPKDIISMTNEIIKIKKKGLEKDSAVKVSIFNSFIENFLKSSSLEDYNGIFKEIDKSVIENHIFYLLGLR